MKKIIVNLILMFYSLSALSQNTDCSSAVSQLQSYSMQVNQIYQAEYWTVIPNQRCPAYNAYGQPFNPYVVQNCRNQMLIGLNQWYVQQSSYVNNVYNQLIYSCTSQPQSIEKRETQRIVGTKVAESIDEDLDDLITGVDEEKTVKIKIPKTAAGFKPRN